MATNNHPKADSNTPRFGGVSVCWPWKTDNAPQLPFSFSVPSLPNTNISSPQLLETRFNLFSPVNSNAAPWLARMIHLSPEESTVLNPFNLQDYMLCSPSVKGEISLSDCNAVEVARPWSLVAKARAAGEVDTVSKKVVGGWNLQSDYDFAVLVQLKDREECGLFFLRIHDKEWVPIAEDTRILDIACHNAKFYAFQMVDWKVGVIDPKKDSIFMEFIDAPGVLLEPIDDAFCVSFDGCRYIICGVYFVACETGLYLVIHSLKVGSDDEVSEKATMMVFNLKEDTGEWERVASLADETLFIGYDVSFGVSSKNLPNWNPGSICLFTSPFPMIYDSCATDFRGLPQGDVSFPEYWRCLRMYNTDEEEKGIVPFKKLSMEKYTGLFFPPPSFVKWRCPSLDNAEVSLHNITFSGVGEGGYSYSTEDE